MFTPLYIISPSLLETIKQITVRVHVLNQQAVPEPVQMQLVQQARVTSTYASTSIEGNPLPLTDVKRLLKTRPEQVRHSEQEVLNYNEVLQELSAAPAAPLTKAHLLEIHRGVTKGLLPAHQTGRFRREPIVIREPGRGEIVFLPPNHQDVEKLVEELLAFVHEKRAELDPLILAGLFHKQFMIIHPFMDGNGRTGRLATSLLLREMGLALWKMFSFENYYNQNVTRYFQQVGEFGDFYERAGQIDFTPWLEYFVEGIMDELLRVQKVIFQARATPEQVLKSYHRKILAYIDEHGFITDRDYARLTERAKATRNLDFNKLIDMGLIVRKGRGRSTYYRRAGD